MIQIRNSVFETNSSSSHSIVVAKGGQIQETVDPGWHVRDDGEIKIWDEKDLEFGRYPFDVLSDWYGRLRYAIAAIGQTAMDEIVAACKRHIPGFDHFKLPQSNWDDGGDYFGYIDHQSFGLLRHMLTTHQISIEEFIFNDKYIVIIDGDEYCVFERLCDSFFFSDENIDYIESAND